MDQILNLYPGTLVCEKLNSIQERNCNCAWENKTKCALVKVKSDQKDSDKNWLKHASYGYGTYPGPLAFDVRRLEGAVDLGLMGLQTLSISGCLSVSPSMNP